MKCWKLNRNIEDYQRLAELRGEKLADHIGYSRDNNGDWIISDDDGRVATAAFRGKAKRGEAWHAPDSEGLASAYLIAAAPEQHEALLNAPLPNDFASPSEFEVVYLKWFHGPRAQAIAKAEGGAR